MNGMRLRFQKGDIAAIVFTLLFAAVVFAAFLPGKESGSTAAEIYRDGDLIRTVSLDTEQEFTISADYTNTVSVRGGQIAITHSDCPGADCVHSGWISSSGRSIVCLPNLLEIRIVSDSGGVDFVVG